MNAPANIPRKNFADVLRCAFLTPMLMAESAISEGELYNEFFPPLCVCAIIAEMLHCTKSHKERRKRNVPKYKR